MSVIYYRRTKGCNCDHYSNNGNPRHNWKYLFVLFFLSEHNSSIVIIIFHLTSDTFPDNESCKMNILCTDFDQRFLMKPLFRALGSFGWYCHHKHVVSLLLYAVCSAIFTNKFEIVFFNKFSLVIFSPPFIENSGIP